MTNFEKIRKIYLSLGYEYFGWNSPDKPTCYKNTKGYFLNKKHIPHPKNIIKNPHNNPDWNCLMELINMINFDLSTLGKGPYDIDKVLDEMYKSII